jgi:hypothetical protein
MSDDVRIASPRAPRMRSTFPSRSPTTTFSWASAILTGTSSPLRRERHVPEVFASGSQTSL